LTSLLAASAGFSAGAGCFDFDLADGGMAILKIQVCVWPIVMPIAQGG